MDFKDSRTYENLLDAFNFEITNMGLYELYSTQAWAEQYIEIAKTFAVFSRHDLEHARVWLRLLNEGTLPNTLENLRNSVQRVNNNIYAEYSLIAKEEGYDEIASLFGGMGIIDSNQDLTFDTFIREIEQDQVSCKPEETLWICQACGNIMSGLCAPERCPICGFPQGYYKVYDCIV